MELFKILGTVAISTNDAQNQLDKMSGKANSASTKMTSAFKKIGSAVATYLSITAIANFGKACIAAASDVEEMQNKFDVVFQGMTEEVEAWAESYANAIGRNSNTIKGYLADNQNMFVGMGMTRESAAGLSENLVSLALDLASFNNISEDDAVNAMSKALMGETESAKRLGAVLNDNTRAEAMAQLGLKGKYEKLTEAQKMEVNYQAILNQSADAVGDCERSLDSYKGQQIQLTSTTEHLKERIGEYLLPVMTKLTGIANNIATFFLEHLDPAFEKVRDSVQKAKDKFAAVGDYLSATFAPVINNTKEIFTKLKDACQPLIDKISQIYDRLSEYVTSGEAAADSTNLLKEAVQFVADALETATDYISKFISWMEDNSETVETFAIILGSIATAILLVNSYFAIHNGIIAIYNGIMTAATAVSTAFGSVMAFITSPIFLVTAAIAAVIAIVVLCIKHWDEIKAKVIEVAGKMKDAISNAVNSIISWFTSLPGRILAKAKEMYSTAVEFMTEFANGILSGFLELVGKVGEWVQSNLISPIEGKVAEFIGVGKKVVDNIKQGIADAWSALTQWFEGIWSKLFGNRTVNVDVNGSNNTGTPQASGLDYVPYNNYPAMLHEGEAVLTASEAKAWRKGESGTTNGVTIIQNITAVAQTPVQLASATAAYFETARWAL